MIAEDQIQGWFTYHPPTQDQAVIYETIRAHAREFAHIINNLVPDGADKSDAMRKLRECVMTANAGIAGAGPIVSPVARKVVERAELRAQARKADTLTRSPYQTTTSSWSLPIVPPGPARKAVRKTSAKTIDDLVDDYMAGRK